MQLFIYFLVKIKKIRLLLKIVAHSFDVHSVMSIFKWLNTEVPEGQKVMTFAEIAQRSLRGLSPAGVNGLTLLAPKSICDVRIWH